MAQYFIKQNPNCINIEHHDPPMILTFHSRFVETEASVCEDSSSAWRRSSVPLLDSWDTRSVATALFHFYKVLVSSFPTHLSVFVSDVH